MAFYRVLSPQDDIRTDIFISVWSSDPCGRGYKRRLNAIGRAYVFLETLLNTIIIVVRDNTTDWQGRKHLVLNDHYTKFLILLRHLPWDTEASVHQSFNSSWHLYGYSRS